MSNAPEIKYSDYYVAFLDILGFKALVKSNKREDKQKIYEYFRLIKQVTNEIKHTTSKKEIGSIVISDSVILSMPIEKDASANIRKLRELCIAIRRIQFKLAEMNIWLRGAISSGKAYFDSNDSQVVGPAYINAFLLEERIALNPRVVIDNKLIKELELESAQELIERVNYDTSCSREYDALERNILFEWIHGVIQKKGLEKDVPLFIDYLVYAFEDESKLKLIIKNIEKSMYLEDNAVYSKFRWVTDYLLSSGWHYNDYMPCNIDNENLMNQLKRLQKL